MTVVSDGIDTANYPELRLEIAVSDANGRAPSELMPANIAVPNADIVAVTPKTNGDVPAAYLFAIDASASMFNQRADGAAYVDVAASVIRTLVMEQLRPKDFVRIVVLGGPTTDAAGDESGWVPRAEKENPTTQIVEALTAIDRIAEPRPPLDVQAALVGLAGLAKARPPDVHRAAIILLTDVDTSSKITNLATVAMPESLGAPLFIAALREPVAGVDDQLRTLFTDAAVLTGGAFIGPNGNVFAAIESSRRTWEVVVRDPGWPDGLQHDLTLTVSASGKQGSVTHHYRSGDVFDVTPLTVAGIEAGERVAADRDIVFGLPPGHWAATRLELFRNCTPARCKDRLAVAEDGPLRWRLNANDIDQGRHTLVVRLTARDEQGNEFSGHDTLDFVRSGSTFNLNYVFLLGGIAVVAVVTTAIAARGRSVRRSLHGGRW